MKTFFLKLALLMGMTCFPLSADDYCYLGSDFLEPGFSTGIYGTFQTVYFNTRDRLTDGDDGDIYLWRYDSLQKAPGGGCLYQL